MQSTQVFTLNIDRALYQVILTVFTIAFNTQTLTFHSFLIGCILFVGLNFMSKFIKQRKDLPTKITKTFIEVLDLFNLVMFSFIFSFAFKKLSVGSLFNANFKLIYSLVIISIFFIFAAKFISSINNST